MDPVVGPAGDAARRPRHQQLGPRFSGPRPRPAAAKEPTPGTSIPSSPVVNPIHSGRSAAADPAPPTSLDALPLMLTIDDAAAVLRISRTTAYKLVQLHRTTGGRAGLPHVRLGSRLVVRRVDLARIVGFDPER